MTGVPVTPTTPLQTGQRWRSQVCATEVVVVRAPAEPVTLGCGGAPMIALGGDPDPRVAAGGVHPGLDGGTLIGKRYADPGGTLELLATKAGAGTLAAGDTPLAVKTARALPSSD